MTTLATYFSATLVSLLPSTVLSLGIATQPTPAAVIPPEQLAQGLRPLSEVPVLDLPSVDLARLRAEDQRAPTDGPAPPLRFADPHAVRISPAADGLSELTRDNSSTVWRLRLTSGNAVSINLGFTRYNMPRGGALFIYTPNYEEIVGPFTEADNAPHGELWTPILPGHDVVIEVSVPTGVTSELDLELGFVNRGYRPDAQRQGDCNIDVVCEEGDDFRDIIRSVGMFHIKGTTKCSGVLLNNTSKDGTPYFLTGSHCGVTHTNAASIVVYWNYESPKCGLLSSGSKAQYQQGAQLRAAWRGTDFALIELDSAPRPTYDVYWAGWNRRDANPTVAIGIHHPSGDEKAISFENDQPTTTPFPWASSATTGDSHIVVHDWDHGRTERGSSGSALFDYNGHVIGQLHATHAACSGATGPTWYGRVSTSWTGGGTPETRLKDWLDPESTGRDTLNGWEPEDAVQ